MITIRQYLGNDHDYCDELFVRAEEAVANEIWEDARTALQAFHDALEKHFTREEKVLFKAFEAAGSGQDGPVDIMRLEHWRMRDMIIDLDHAVFQRDKTGYLNISETLLVLMQQHNGKEEGILYPLCDRVLQSSCNHLISEMRDLDSEPPCGPDWLEDQATGS